MPRTDERLEFDGLTFVRWVDATRQDAETWYLDVDDLMVWVKDYGPIKPGQHHDSPFYGWRVGVGGSPRRTPCADRDAAMREVRRIALAVAQERVDKFWEAHRAAVGLRDSLLPKEDTRFDPDAEYADEHGGYGNKEEAPHADV